MGSASLPRGGAAAVLGVAVALAAPCPALANGNNAHTWISLEAIEHLPDGRLKEILSEPDLQEIMLNGAMFPDGGYVIEDRYGEIAHWEPFIDAYRAWIAREFERPYTQGKAAQHVAFLMGIASHSMADQVYDSQFMDMARYYDAEGWGEGLIYGFDTASDVLLVADTGFDLVFESWVPADEISRLYADDFGYTIHPGALWTAQDMLHRVVLTYPRETGLNDPERTQEYREQYPWAAANIMDPLVPGTPPTEALVVAAYWQSMWFRLHEEAGPDMVIATAPGAGGRGHPTNHRLVDSQVAIVFGHGVDLSSLGPDAITVADAEDTPHEVYIDLFRGDDACLVRLRPREDWAADTTYTVTLHPGITTMTGVALAEPFSFEFSTAAETGEPVPPCTDPTPFAGEPDLGEPVDSGGCTIHGPRDQRAAPMWSVLAAVLLLAIRRPR